MYVDDIQHCDHDTVLYMYVTSGATGLSITMNNLSNPKMALTMLAFL